MDIRNFIRKRSTVEINQLTICLIVAVVFTCFSFYRAAIGDWPFFYWNTAFAAAYIGIFILISILRSVDVTGSVLSTSIIAGVAATIIFWGKDHNMWAYPALLAPIFMVRAKVAVVLICLGLLLFTALFYLNSSQYEFSRVVMGLVANLAFAFLQLRSSNAVNKQLQDMTRIDTLTGIGNRLALNEDIHQLIDNKTVHEYTLAVVDLDYFKSINDQHGHLVGDRVLREFCAHSIKRVPKSLTLYRYGGEEFVALIHEPLMISNTMLNDWLNAIRSHDFGIDRVLSFSCGVAEYQVSSIDNWVSRADFALLKAKQQGRSCIVVGV